MHLPFFIARRYLFAKKSHNVINVISAISGVGIAVGTAALIIILSVFNGFDELVKATMSTVDPDFAVVPREGKFFVPSDDAVEDIRKTDGVKNVCKVLQDNVVVDYGGTQSTALAKGVDPIFEAENPIRSYVTGGKFVLKSGSIRNAALGSNLASEMGVQASGFEEMSLYYPDRYASYSALNPLGMLNTVKVWPSCTFKVGNEMDSELMIVAYDVMEELLGAENEASALEIRLEEGLSSRDIRGIQERISGIVGGNFKVLDRFGQNPDVYKMLKYEKFAVYMIMIFIVVILGFSIFGSMRMMIIEKKEDIAAMETMGVTKSTVRRIFTIEGWLITVTGLLAGTVTGIAFCLLQQHFGIIKMPGNYVVDAYPVVLQWTDVAVSMLSISLLGYIIALIPARSIK